MSTLIITFHFCTFTDLIGHDINPTILPEVPLGLLRHGNTTYQQQLPSPYAHSISGASYYAYPPHVGIARIGGIFVFHGGIQAAGGKRNE